MNLTHLSYELFQCDIEPEMTAENLAVLFDLADKLESAIHNYTEAIETIRTEAPKLWSHRKGPRDF